MFASNIRELMDNKKMTVRDLVKLTGMSSRTIQRAISDGSIHKCELGTLAKIGLALGVKTKRLYDEVDNEKGVS
ncbi:helix-turn-helix transcriptional regulator [uncultured Desulfovibrio sp.]|uniref:helix-turn-helix domain-containing protein n=1 Tax=uncultured Desulfovibrio sp. TaxID=167968 RepID=UPI00262FAC9D|nr:helix-turn-helix transcriptional regulator [uncultured Desulfovibrio sp.]